MRPRASFPLGERGISRFPCEVFPCVLGVCDRAELRYALLYRRIRCCLPPAPTASASRRMCLSRLNTRPVRSPVNASTPLWRAAPHESGPVWIATPSPYDSFILYTLPVFIGPQEPNSMLNEVILIGRRGQNAEAKTAQNNREYVVLNIATQESWKNDKGDYENPHRVAS